MTQYLHQNSNAPQKWRSNEIRSSTFNELEIDFDRIVEKLIRIENGVKGNKKTGTIKI